ncbi:hypothetical protein PR048_015533 [Dryococelus australis]|uniref:Uncharacterized protein n=1 Tax=Dryococelus australis TaxID=614101 RepID=A0ABQ9HH80_9NEOP|nr:hypothetical protein PR048_015533 [Dryococelus australis]
MLRAAQNISTPLSAVCCSTLDQYQPALYINLHALPAMLEPAVPSLQIRKPIQVLVPVIRKHHCGPTKQLLQINVLVLPRTVYACACNFDYSNCGRGRSNIVVRLLASHLCEPASILSGAAPGFSHLGTVLDDASCRRAFSEISRFPCPCILALLHTHLTLPPSALKISTLRAVQISPLHSACPSTALNDNAAVRFLWNLPIYRFGMFGCKGWGWRHEAHGRHIRLRTSCSGIPGTQPALGFRHVVSQYAAIFHHGMCAQRFGTDMSQPIRAELLLCMASSHEETMPKHYLRGRIDCAHTAPAVRGNDLSKSRAATMYPFATAVLSVKKTIFASKLRIQWQLTSRNVRLGDPGIEASRETPPLDVHPSVMSFQHLLPRFRNRHGWVCCSDRRNSGSSVHSCIYVAPEKNSRWVPIRREPFFSKKMPLCFGERTKSPTLAFRLAWGPSTLEQHNTQSELSLTSSGFMRVVECTVELYLRTSFGSSSSHL